MSPITILELQDIAISEGISYAHAMILLKLNQDNFTSGEIVDILKSSTNYPEYLFKWVDGVTASGGVGHEKKPQILEIQERGFEKGVTFAQHSIALELAKLGYGASFITKMLHSTVEYPDYLQDWIERIVAEGEFPDRHFLV